MAHQIGAWLVLLILAYLLLHDATSTNQVLTGGSTAFSNGVKTLQGR